MNTIIDDPLVSVVVVTRNRRADLMEALQSLRDQTYVNIEVVVVNNGSGDDTVEKLRENFPEVALVDLDQNTGAYHGRNTGAAATKGEILYFLDDDTSLDSDAIARIVERFSQEAALGVIVCRMVMVATGEETILSNFLTDPDQEFYLGDMVAEGATAIRRDVFEGVGQWAAHYFRSHVGKDLSYRIIDAGYNILYLPSAIAYDKASPLGDFSRKQIEKQKVFYITRNQLWIVWKYLPLRRAAAESVVKIAFYFLQSIKKGAPHMYLGGLAAAIISMPRVLLKERRPVSRKTLDKIDYLSYGTLTTDPKTLESFTPLASRTIYSRRLAALFGLGGEAKSR